MNGPMADRRAVLALLSTAALSLRGRAIAAASAAAQAPAPNADACVGLYRGADGSSIGIERFITDAGKRVLFWSDNRTGDVRTLFPRTGREFALVRGFDEGVSAERVITFQPASGGAVAGFRLSDPATGGTARTVTFTRVLTRDETVSFEQGDARLAGTLILPAGRGPHPAVILLHGSGPLTRHSFGPYPRFFSSLGLAVLMFDKRGTGASTGRLMDASSVLAPERWPAFYPEDLLQDALAAHRYLKSRREIDPRRIGCWGSSEGGMLATQVAAHAGDLAFAIDSSGFMGPLWETFLYQSIKRAQRRLPNPEEAAEAAAWFRYTLEVARTGRGWDEYAARREALLGQGKDWLKLGVDYTSLEQMRWSWERILSFSALPALARVNCPVLGVWGQDDPLTDAPVAAAALAQALTAGGNRDVTTRVFPNAGHSLMEQSEASRLVPGVFDTLRDWLSARVLRH